MAGLLSTDGKDSSSTTAGTSTASYLVPRTLYGTLIKAVRKNLVFRSLAAVIIGPGSIPGSSIDVPLQTHNTMSVFQVDQGGAIGIDSEEYSGFNLKPVKYGVRIPITTEMIEDSLIDVMSMNVETAGYELADNEDQLIVAQLNAGAAASSGSDHEVANSNATLPVTDITAGMQSIETDNHKCTHIIVGAEVANDIRNIDSFTEADKAGINDPSQVLIGKIFGMKVLVSNNVSAKLAYIIDASKAFIIAEKRPVTIEKYKDYSRDTNFAVATQRIVVRYLREDAIAEITTT